MYSDVPFCRVYWTLVYVRFIYDFHISYASGPGGIATITAGHGATAFAGVVVVTLRLRLISAQSGFLIQEHNFGL